MLLRTARVCGKLKIGERARQRRAKGSLNSQLLYLGKVYYEDKYLRLHNSGIPTVLCAGCVIQVESVLLYQRIEIADMPARLQTLFSTYPVSPKIVSEPL